LAARAEQLQASIGYFHLGAGSHGPAVRPAVRPVAVARSAHAVSGPQRPVAKLKRAGVAGPAGGQMSLPASLRPGRVVDTEKGHAGGFALDLTTGGADAADAEFERI
jgi:methyl-accepting chemotaxis protein